MHVDWTKRYDEAVALANAAQDEFELVDKDITEALSVNRGGVIQRWLESAELDRWAIARAARDAAQSKVGDLLTEIGQKQGWV